MYNRKKSKCFSGSHDLGKHSLLKLDWVWFDLKKGMSLELSELNIILLFYLGLQK